MPAWNSTAVPEHHRNVTIWSCSLTFYRLLTFTVSYFMYSIDVKRVFRKYISIGRETIYGCSYTCFLYTACKLYSKRFMDIFLYCIKKFLGGSCTDVVVRKTYRQTCFSRQTSRPNILGLKIIWHWSRICNTCCAEHVWFCILAALSGTGNSCIVTTYPLWHFILVLRDLPRQPWRPLATKLRFRTRFFAHDF